MPAWHYFAKPRNSQLHDLTTRRHKHKHLRALLGLGSKFIPIRTGYYYKSELKQAIKRFIRDLHIKTLWAPSDSTDFNAYLYTPSKYQPPASLIPKTIHERLFTFSRTLRKQFKQRTKNTNLLSHEHHQLQHLMRVDDILIVKCDKIWVLPSLTETATSNLHYPNIWK